MKNDFLIKYRLRIALTLLLAPFACALFWYLANTHKVYDSALAGALFEIAWLPVILITFEVPVVSFICWSKDKQKLRSVFLPVSISSILLVIWIMNL